MRFITASESEIARARAFKSAYRLLREVPEVKRGSKAEIEVVITGLQGPADVRLLLNDKEALATTVTPEDGRALVGVARTRSGRADLKVELARPSAAAWVEARVQIAAGRQTLAIEVVDPYPPRLWLGRDIVNPVPGLHLRPRGEAPPAGDAGPLLRVIDETRTAVDLPPERFDIWVDGARVEPLPGLAEGVLLGIHQQRVSTGAHRIRIGIPAKRRIVLDTMVVADGVNDVRVFVAPRISGHAQLTLWQGASLLLEESTDDAEGDEGLMVMGDVGADLDPKDIPPDLDKEKVKEALASSTTMRDNFKAFVDERKRVRAKKAGGEKLTGDEAALDAIGTGKELKDWFRAKKKKEGVSTKVVGTTSASGKSTYELPEPTTPWEKFDKAMTMDVHEASHRAACKADAEKVGLDWDKLSRFLELADSGAFPTDDMMEWVHANKAKIKEYLELRDDPDRTAEEEIREYEEEIRIYKGILMSK